ncbi:DUF7560 family zinc ribbon protein [Halarchaeum sp. P4]
MSSAESQTFTCPECAASIPVDGAARDALLANGCPVCASDIPASAFDD